jgi:hypothetical protein
MFIKIKDVPQDRYPVWENIVLIEAGTEEEAFKKAEERGRLDEGDDGGSLRWGKKPATWVFAGVRKLTACEDPDERPGDGTELSYSEMELDSLEAVKKLASGKQVQVTYNDRYRPVRKEPKVEPKPARRRRA